MEELVDVPRIEPSGVDDSPDGPSPKHIQPNYCVGDHVLVAPAFQARDGGPYTVCRIIALPDTLPGDIPRARVAYYLRRRDVTNRSLADFRVIFATFMAGTIPMSHIRQRCYVMHRDYLEDPEAFKREDDSFVFSQIYDRFMHKPFDLIPASQVMNAPDNILTYLRSNYEFVCTELGTSGELSDAMRGCAKCHAFASKDDSVTCAVCSKTWHLNCLDPPLAKKPALGWHWSCIKCTMMEDGEESDSDNLILATNDRNATRAAAAATIKSKDYGGFRRKKDWKGKGPAVQPQLEVSKRKMTNGWPYRYFGQHVDHSSIFDPDDSIWPRASTRIGTRYQAMSIPGEEPDNIRKPPHKKPKGRRSAKEATSIEKERGGDEACVPIWIPDNLYSDQELDDYLKVVRQMPIYRHQGTVDILEYALKLLQKSTSMRSATNKLHKMTLEDLPNLPSLATWASQEIALFDKNIETFDDELSDFKRNLVKKSLPQIVHHYYREKGHQRQHLNYEDAAAKDKFGAAGPSGMDADQEEASEDDSSLAGTPPPNRKLKRFCAVCLVEDAEQWYKCPAGLGEATVGRKEKTLCQSCAIQWRHYGNPNPALSLLELDARAAKDKKGVRKVDKGKTESRSPSPALSESARRPPSAPPITAIQPIELETPILPIVKMLLPVKPCVMCKRPEPKQTNYMCHNCGISLHTGCYGISEETERADFLCDLCRPDINENRRVKPACSVCPPSSALASTPISALDALKRTDGAGYIHLLCAIWHHEFFFRDSVLLDIAEGVESIDLAKYDKTCSLCNQKGTGACVKCEGCNSHFHVSCAWTANYRFSFEIMPIKKKRQKEVPTARFKTEEGDMRPLITCKAHPYIPTRLLYDLGQKDKATGLTALMTFTTSFKGIKVADSFPLLRRARRLDNTTQPALRHPDTLLHVSKSDVLQNSEGSPRDPHINPVEDQILDDLYEVKQPYIKKPKVKRMKRSIVSVPTAKLEPVPARLPSVHLEPVSQSEHMPVRLDKIQQISSENSKEKSPSTVHVYPAAPLASTELEGKPKKKKQRRKKQVSDAEQSWSDDEVMPAASTSRSRKTARSVRAVQKADLLNSERSLSPGGIGQSGHAPVPESHVNIVPSNKQQEVIQIAATAPNCLPLHNHNEHPLFPPQPSLIAPIGEIKLPSIRSVTSPIARPNSWRGVTAHQPPHSLPSSVTPLTLPPEMRSWLYSPLYLPPAYSNGQHRYQYQYPQPPQPQSHSRPHVPYGVPAPRLFQVPPPLPKPVLATTPASSRPGPYSGYNSLTPPSAALLSRPLNQPASIAPANSSQ